MQKSDDVEFETEDESPADQLKKLRERLTKCAEEKQEYLDGWQRAKADFVNAKKESEARLAGAGEAGKDALARDLGPVFDALDSAMATTEGNGKVSEGVRNIAAQLLAILKRAGIEPYGAVGDAVDPRLYETVTTESPPESALEHTVAKVHQRGMRRGDHIIRPATVTVYQKTEN